MKNRLNDKGFLKKLYISLFLFTLITSLAFFVFEAQAAVFERDLKLGDTGSDVLELQRVLNADPETRLASFGPGSPGSETSYFGPITKNAVARFQEKHAAEILHPLGLFRGTGYFGPSTRTKLNNTSAAAKGPGFTVINSSPPPERTESSSSSQEPKIFSVTPSSGKIGTNVVLRGEGFDEKNNTVYASFAKLENISSPNGKTIEFEVGTPLPIDIIKKLPDNRASLIPDFVYEFKVENSRGMSNAVEFILRTDF